MHRWVLGAEDEQLTQPGAQEDFPAEETDN